MKVFAVRLNPDPRGGTPYTKYPTVDEYKSIHSSSPMNGFHEAVNFKSENGRVRGYLPPKHLKSMRDGKPFALITMTAKTAKKGADLIVGIQADCRYCGENPRGGAENVKKLGLVWHYTCQEELSMPLDKPIPDARSIILGDNNTSWMRIPTYQLGDAATKRVLNIIEKSLKDGASKAKFARIKSLIMEGDSVADQFDEDTSFDDEVQKAFHSDLSHVEGNKLPRKKEIRSLQYERDPRVVAYVLKASKGICHDCQKPGPFISKITGLPYLEVHHVKMLKDGGEDTIQNAVALCPNCHRKRHYA
jgi:hypothetical protein